MGVLASVEAVRRVTLGDLAIVLKEENNKTVILKTVKLRFLKLTTL